MRESSFETPKAKTLMSQNLLATQLPEPQAKGNDASCRDFLLLFETALLFCNLLTLKPPISIVKGFSWQFISNTLKETPKFISLLSLLLEVAVIPWVKLTGGNCNPAEHLQLEAYGRLAECRLCIAARAGSCLYHYCAWCREFLAST